MGRCQEFGPQIRDGCGHAMRAGDSACFCSECGVTCQGRYPGCPDVWKRGHRNVTTAVVTVDRPRLQQGLGGVVNGNPEAATAAEPRRARPGIGNVIASGPREIEGENPRRTRFEPDPMSESTTGIDAVAAVEAAAPAEPPPPGPGNGSASPVVENRDDDRAWAPPRQVSPPRAEPDVASAANGGNQPMVGVGLGSPPPSGPASPAPPPQGRASSAPPPRREAPSPPASAGSSRPDPPAPTVLPATPADSSPAPGEVDPRTHILKWMERRFDGLREEMRLLAGGARRQSDMLDEVLERQAELEALIERQADLGAHLERQPEMDARQAELDARRLELDARQAELDARLADLETGQHERHAEPALDARGNDLLQAAHDELSRLVTEMVVASQQAGEATESSIAAQRETSERLRLLQTAVTRELRSLTTAVATLTDSVGALVSKAPSPGATTTKATRPTSANKDSTAAKSATAATKTARATKVAAKRTTSRKAK